MAGSSQDTTQSGQARSRLGCLCCRRRRRKCDGTQPRCRNCQARGEKCLWGLKASFHPSRTLHLSSEDSAALLAIEGERGRPEGRAVTTIVDNTDQIVREYEHLYNATSKDLENLEVVADPLDSHLDVSTSVHHLETPAAEYADLNLTPSRSVVFNHNVPDVVADPIVTAQNRGLVDCGHFLQSALPSSAWDRQSNQEIASSTSPLAAFLSDHTINLTASLDIEAELPVSTSEQTQLLRAYLQETGTWCETTDSGRHFTVSYVHKLMENRPFASAAIALASRQLDALRHNQRQSTLKLYQHAVHSLLHSEPSQCGEASLATCTVLTVYEMMASDVGEWRRHLKGCIWNLESKGWNGSSPGLVNACFWAFARIDVWRAFILGEETLMPDGDWVDDSNVRSVAATGAIDAYCNLATLIVAKIINCIATNKKRQETLSDTPSKINTLWDELQDWRSHRPREVLSLIRTEADQGNPFPTVLYPSSSSICGNTFYHTGSILLLRTGYVYQKETGAETDIYDPIWHARELGGISATNTSHANWVNHLQPLYIAGQVFGRDLVRHQSDPTRIDDYDIANKEDHAVEKLALLKHLRKIEKETGWITSRRAAELRRLWGLE